MYKLGSGYVMKGLFCSAETTETGKQKENCKNKRKDTKWTRVLGSKTGKTDDRKRKLQPTANNGDEKQTYE